ncbi:MAG: hypothetical protein PWR10_1552 [Halanaerobiales bacterium]|nr:hypothetical protein [Halanaerobiales bacterium]
MMLNKNNKRSRHKINTFPPELVEAINKQLVAGKTYEEITEFINDRGYQIGKSSVGRYGKDFLTKLERLKKAKEQARAIVEEASDRPSTEMHEAANQMAVTLLTEMMMNKEYSPEDISQLSNTFKALAQLERSAVAREKLKYDMDKGVNAAFEKIKSELQKELAKDEELLSRMLKLVENVRKDFSLK